MRVRMQERLLLQPLQRSGSERELKEPESLKKDSFNDV
jgi:hypothetical protein